MILGKKKRQELGEEGVAKVRRQQGGAGQGPGQRSCGTLVPSTCWCAAQLRT